VILTETSGIVPVHNEARVLDRVLDAIERQSRPLDELVLVFDACTDGSEPRFRDRADRAISVRVRNTSAAVRAGIAAASNPLLVLLDGNTVVPEDCVERLVGTLERERADLVEWHGGVMLVPRPTLGTFGPFSDMHLWTLEYFLRVEGMGGKVVRLRGSHRRLRRSPLTRNLRYGLDYADLSIRYGLAPFFRVGTKSGRLPDLVALGGAGLGHLRRRNLGRALRRTVAELRRS